MILSVLRQGHPTHRAGSTLADYPRSPAPGRYVSSQMRHKVLLFPKLSPWADAA